MMVISRFAASLLCLTVLSGCGSPAALMSPKHPYDYRGYVGGDPAGVAMAKIVKDLDDAEASCYKQQDPIEAKLCRDDVIAQTKKYIDQYWREFVSAFHGRFAAGKTAIETSATTLSAAAAITTPPHTASIVSALSASLSAFGTSAQKNLLGDQTAALLIGQMEADRTVIGAKIREGLSEGASRYSLAMTMSDLADYAATMSVPHAMQSLAQAGGSQAHKLKEAEAEAL